MSVMHCNRALPTYQAFIGSFFLGKYWQSTGLRNEWAKFSVGVSVTITSSVSPHCYIGLEVAKAHYRLPVFDYQLRFIVIVVMNIATYL
ncbi:MAG: hypothetical protein ACI89U_002283 [Gammaproteobacteria bacterium]|jgi:hypothetical protein